MIQNMKGHTIGEKNYENSNLTSQATFDKEMTFQS